MAARYAKKPKKKSRTQESNQPPDRGHGTQMRGRAIEVEGANGESRMGRRKHRDPEKDTPRGSLMERLGTTPREGLLSQSDRRLMGELTKALKENSALLRVGEPGEVEASSEPVETPSTSGPRPVDEETPPDSERTASPQSA